MKSKIYFYPYILFSLLVFIGSGCSKQLEIQSQGAPTEATFWKTQSDAQAGVNAIYLPYNDNADPNNFGLFYGRGSFWFINASDDMITGRVKAVADNVRNFNSAYIGDPYLETQWAIRYQVIRAANQVIRNVPNITMSDSIKSVFIGEAYFNSGLMYFQLAANYGDNRAGVPIVTRSNMDDPNPTPRANNVTINYNYVTSELKNAAANLPLFSRLPVSNYGKPHRAAAWAYLAKAYLYEKLYDSAKLYADSVINFGQRALLSNFADVFKAVNNYSSEYIWSVTTSPLNGNGSGSMLPGVMLENKGWGLYNGFGYYMPTQELYNSYVEGDLRRAATILKPGDHFTYFGKDMVYASTNSLSGYQFRKYMDPFSYANPIGVHLGTNANFPVTDLNVPLMRYAEVLLIKAEAAIMLNGAGAGDAELNQIRKRAGLTSLNNMTMVDLKRERRCELAGEWADRHRDLVRWGDAQAAYAQPAHGVNGAICWPARKFDPVVNAVWAVPQQEIDKSNGVITQNKGW